MKTTSINNNNKYIWKQDTDRPKNRTQSDVVWSRKCCLRENDERIIFWQNSVLVLQRSSAAIVCESLAYWSNRFEATRYMRGAIETLANVPFRFGDRFQNQSSIGTEAEKRTARTKPCTNFELGKIEKRDICCAITRFDRRWTSSSLDLERTPPNSTNNQQVNQSSTHFGSQPIRKTRCYRIKRVQEIGVSQSA